MNRILVFSLSAVGIIGSLLLLLSKAVPVQNVSPDKLQISTSFYPLYFFASQIAKEKAVVYNITPAGSEPHDYEPTAQDIARIEKGNMLILNGGVEAWGDKIKQSLLGSYVKVITAGEGLLNQHILEDGQSRIDPHIWLDPMLAKKESEKIVDGMKEVDPANKQYYVQNEKELASKLDDLDMAYKEQLQNCQSREIVTSHAAFGYLARRYDLTQVSIAGLSPDEEPSAKQLASIASYVKTHNIQYIFFESLVSPKLSETIANETGARTLVLDPLEGISDDGIKQGKNYFTVMQSNLSSLKQALQCK